MPSLTLVRTAWTSPLPPGGAELDPSRIVSTKVMFLMPKAAYGDTPTFTNISSSNEGGHPWDLLGHQRFLDPR